MTQTTIGAMEVTMLSDGLLSLPSSFTFGPVPDQIAREVLSVVVQQRRDEPRYIFKK